MVLTQREVKAVYIGTNKVRPVESWWQPWPNTLAYYTFDNQTLLNEATNTVDATWYSWNWAFGTGYGWTGYSANIWTGWAIAISTHIPTGDFTISSCIKFNSYPPASWVFYWWFGNLGLNYSRIHCQFVVIDSIPKLQFYQYDNSANYSASDVRASTWTLNSNTWYNFILTRSGSSVSMYLDGQLIGTWTDTRKNSTQTQTYYLWTAYDATIRKLDGYMDNVIIESVARTAQEVSDYYNLIS